MSTQTLSVVGRLPLTVGDLHLDIKGADVKIRHESRSDVCLMANNPENWTIKDGYIGQTKVQEPRNGGNVIVSGSNIVSVGRGNTVIQSGGRSVSIINGQVWVDGKKVSPEPETESSGPAKGPDQVELLVPENFQAGLTLNYENGSKVSIDSWHGNHIRLCSAGGDDLRAGELTVSNSFVLTSTGGGDVEIVALETKTFTATRTGSGDLKIGELNTNSLCLSQTGSGDTNVARGGATSGSINTTGSGDVSVRGAFNGICKHSIGSGEVKIRPAN